MIENRFDEAEAAKWTSPAGDDPVEQALAARVFTARLIGQDPDLVMHGGGNASVKVTRPDLYGTPREVLHVKGSGWDLDRVLAPGLPGVGLDPLRKLRQLAALSDLELVNELRCNLLDSTSPNPSVETLLHAFLPHTYVDHTHATPFLVLGNLPDAEAACRAVFGDRLGIVPFVMSGLALAKKAAEVYEADPTVEGLILIGHGHVAFGDTARESYDRIVAQTNAVAAHLGMTTPTSLGVRAPADDLSVLPTLRGVMAEMRGSDKAAIRGGDETPMPVMDLRNGAQAMAFLDRPDLDDLAERGTASPDHVIHIKPRPLILRRATWAAGRAAIRAALDDYEAAYSAYFDRNAPLADAPKTMLTPAPKLAWIEGVGIVGMGTCARTAAIAADLGEQNARVRAVGEAHGGFRPIGEKALFDFEYWSLEQAKLGRGRTAPVFEGQVVMVTGGAGTIGLATAQAFARLGANCLLVDLNQDSIDTALATLGPGHAGYVGDITAKGAAAAAMDAAVAAFGGLDILVSNAGAATAGALLDLDDETLRGAFELNFFSHEALSTQAARLMRVQGRPGQILFNISKQAVNPGKNFGAYGLPKAATLFLMRQLALELGGDMIRVNGVNADRIRSGLLNDDFIAGRAKSRGVDEATYMAGNLLGREVEARDVAEAFVALALSRRTTAHVITVDGGNIEAALR